MMLIALIAVAAIAGVSTMYLGWPKDEALPSARTETNLMGCAFVALVAVAALVLLVA